MITNRIIHFILCFTLCIGLMACASGKNSNAVLASNPDSLRVASFNIHYLEVTEKGIDKWNARRGAVTNMIADISPDIIAFQEMESFGGGHSRNENIQLDWVLSQHPDLKAAAYSKDARNYPITQPILYKAALFDVVDQGFFFFSETPDVIYSPTFNGSYPAFCSWATLREKSSGQNLTVFNIHTDYSSSSNREKSVELIKDRIEPRIMAGDAILLLGDLNASNKSKIAETLKSTSLQFVGDAGSTFHFNRGINLTPAIDHILHTQHFKQPKSVTVWRKKYDGKWPGDHYPIFADLGFN